MTQKKAPKNSTNTSRVFRPLKIRQIAGSIPSNIHTNQDVYSIRELRHGNENILVAVMSDGCTGQTTLIQQHGLDFFESKYKTNLGAKWIIDRILDKVELHYSNGLRDELLITQAVLDVINIMPDYIPYDPASLYQSRCGKMISEELVATIYIYIATPQNCTVMLAGNGYLLLNGMECSVGPGKQDAYPIHLLEVDKHLWADAIRKLFPVGVFPTNAIRRLVICTDGVCDHLRKILRDEKNILDFHSILNLLNEQHLIPDRVRLTPWKRTGAIECGDIMVEHRYHDSSCDDATFIALIANGKGLTSTLELSWARLIEQVNDIDIDLYIS